MAHDSASGFKSVAGSTPPEDDAGAGCGACAIGAIGVRSRSRMKRRLIVSTSVVSYLAQVRSGTIDALPRASPEGLRYLIVHKYAVTLCISESVIAGTSVR